MGAIIPGPAGVTFPLTSAGDQSFEPDGVANNAVTFQNAAAAVNGITLVGKPTTVAPTIAVGGSDADIGLNVETKGTGTFTVNGAAVGGVTWPLTNATDEGFQPDGIANNALNLQNATAAVNGLNLRGTATGASPIFSAVGSDTNIGIVVTPKGTGDLTLSVGSLLVAAGEGIDTSAAGVLTLGATTATSITLGASGIPITNAGNMLFRPSGQTGTTLELSQVAAGVWGLEILGSADVSGNGVDVQTIGSGANQPQLTIAAGSNLIFIAGGNTSAPRVLTMGGVASAVNDFVMKNAATGSAPLINVSGSDTNVSFNVTPKGTGLFVITSGGLSMAGHLSTTGTAPTVAAGAQASAAAIVAGSTDTSGSVTATTVAAPAAGALFTLTFAVAYAAAPKTILLTVQGAGALDIQPSAIATTGFTGTLTGTLPAGSTAFTIGYLVVA